MVVIGRRGARLSPEEALGCVLGYTCGNDVSARDWQRGDIQWWRGKSSDTFAPVGPWIVDGLDPTNLHLQTRVNGEVKQSCNTRLLIHSVAHIISFASRVMTLEPGDVIFTGTPGHPHAMKPGDVVEVEIEGIGVLRNAVREEGVRGATRRLRYRRRTRSTTGPKKSSGRVCGVRAIPPIDGQSSGYRTGFASSDSRASVRSPWSRPTGNRFARPWWP